MNAASGNPKSKAARKVLHQDRNSVDMDDAEFKRVTTLLSDFFTEKLHPTEHQCGSVVNDSLRNFPSSRLRGRTFDGLQGGDG